MESDRMQPENQPGSSSPGGQTVLLSILSQSPDTPEQFTFDNLPLSTKVSEIKARITLAVPSRPDPESQRLLYRGRVLANNGEELRNIVDHSASNVHSMRLILPSPTMAPRPRPTTETLRPPPPPERLLSDSAADERRSDDDSSLRYRGEQQRRREASERLGRYMRDFETTIRDASRMFPQQPPPADDYGDSSDTADSGPGPAIRNGGYGDQQGHLDSVQRNYNATNTAPTARHPALRHGNLQGTAVGPQVQGTGLRGTYPLPSQRPLPSLGYRYEHLRQNHVQLANNTRIPLSQVTQRVMSMEDQVAAGHPPTAEEISLVRFQLHQLLEGQYISPRGLQDARLDSWIARLSAVAMRADQLRPPAADNASHDQMFMVTSPDGPYGVIMPSAGLGGVQPQVTQLASSTTAIPTNTAIGRRARPPMPTFRIGQNVLQIPQERRPAIRASIDLMRVARGLWLFTRLYFFCYLLTPRGTWTRTIFVTLSLITAVISQTRFPQRVQSIVLDPIRRHLENLVPLERRPDGDPIMDGLAAVRDDAVAGGNRPARPNQNQNQNPEGPSFPHHDQQAPAPVRAPAASLTGMAREYATIAERAIVVFLATLVPGIGERYVNARNVAENQQRRQEQGNEGQNRAEGDAGNEAGEAARGAQQAEVEVGQH